MRSYSAGREFDIVGVEVTLSQLTDPEALRHGLAEAFCCGATGALVALARKDN